jgi:hypothetical protein
MDSLGGILTGGLLGNPILGYFNLSLFNIIEIQVERVIGHSVGYTDYVEDEPGKLTFKINMFKNSYIKTFTISNNKINIMMRLIKTFKKLKKRILNVTMNKQIKIDNIKVKINAKN